VHSTTRRGVVAVVALLLVTTPVAGVVSDGSPVADAPTQGSTDLLPSSADTRTDVRTDATSPFEGVAGSASAGPKTAESVSAEPRTARFEPDGTRVGPTSDERFASDAAAARALGPVERASNATVTATGGRAWARGTDDIVDGAPLSISVTQRVALTPEQPGEVQVTHVFDIPGSVEVLETSVPEGATVTGGTGFTPVDGGYEWNGNTSRARLTYTMAVNETISQVGPEGAAGRYLLVDAGEWALVRRPDLSVRWSWSGPVPVGLDRQAVTAGPGYAGEAFVYLGAVDTRSRRAHGQTFTLVVPDRATMVESPDAVLDTLADSSDRLRVGDRDEQVTMFVAPTTSGVEWGVRGLQYGDTEAWVRDAEPLGEPDNTWIHEYVHTRQSFRTADSGQWLPEATATYYAALLTLERNETDFTIFREFLGRGARAPQAGAVLVEPRSWDNAANYWKGALVTAAIDRQIRLATNGTRSFGAVFSRLNAYPNAVDWGVTLELIERVGGDSVDQFAGTYITTSRVPPAWSVAEHETAFGPTPARFTYRFADRQSDIANATESEVGDRDNVTVGFAVSGPYRNGTVEGGPLTLYTGETLHATGVVTNAGGANASYEQFFSVGGRVERTVSGALAPGETRIHTLNYTADTTGGRTVSFGADTVDIEVYDPAPATLGDVVVNRTRLQGPGVVGVDVTVENPHDAPARRTVTVTRDGQEVWIGFVGVPAGANRTVTAPVHLNFSGQYVVGVIDGPSTRVTVGASASTPSPTDRLPGSPGTAGDPAAPTDPGDPATSPEPTDDGGTAGSGPGFGVVVTLLTALLTTLALGRRRS
jgi:hypothetical protein